MRTTSLNSSAIRKIAGLILLIPVSLFIFYSTAMASGTPKSTKIRVKVTDAGKLYSTYPLENYYPVQKQLLDQGVSQDQLKEIITWSKEHNWPEKINFFSKQLKENEMFGKYITYYVGQFDDKLVLLVPQSENQHMPEGFKPDRDIYFLIGMKGAERITMHASAEK